MAAATVELLTDFEGLTPAHATLPMAGSYKALKGTIVCRDANGRAAAPVAAGAAGTPAAGVAEATFDNSAGANDAMLAELKLGIFALAYTGTAPKFGETVYVVDNQTVSTSNDDGSSFDRGVAGVSLGVRDGKASVFMGPLAGVLLTIINRIIALEEAV